MNTTILQLVAIYKIQLHVSALYVGVSYILLQTVILLCSWLYVCIDIYMLQLCII